jgi:predicted PurR-regulated permease PerM
VSDLPVMAVSLAYAPWLPVVRLLSVAAMVWLGVWILLAFKSLVILLSIVVAVTYVLYSPLQTVQGVLARLCPDRWPVRFLSLLALLVLLAGVLLPLGYTLWHIIQTESRDLLQDIPPLFKSVGLDSKAAVATEGWADFAKVLGEWLTHGVAHLLHGVAAAILVLYLLVDGAQLRLRIAQVLPTPVQRLADDCHLLLKSYVAEQLLVSLFSGLVMTGLYSVLGFKYPVLLGAFHGVCSCLPVAGPWLGLLPGLVLSVVGPAPERFGDLLLGAGGLYLFKEYVMLPYVIGNTLEIYPVYVILAFLAGMELFGLLGGLFLALPLASLLAALARQVQRI